MGRGRTAQRERERKELHPDLYCRKAGCLWRLSSGPCRKHPNMEAQRDRSTEHRQAPEDAE